MNRIATLLLATAGLWSINSFAGGSANNISWNCTQLTGTQRTWVTIKNGVATVSGVDIRTAMTPITVGGPYSSLETFGGGDFVGVRSANDDSFSLIAGSLTYETAAGQKVHLDNVVCK